jgi:predicted RecB family nuclease
MRELISVSAAADEGWMARARLEDLGGLTRAQAHALRVAGVRNLDELRKAAYARGGREDLASRAGIEEQAILEAARHADLCRVEGVGPDTADLLYRAGVRSVRELSERQASDLARSCLRTLREQNRRRARMPSVSAIGRWITCANSLPPGIEL